MTALTSCEGVEALGLGSEVLVRPQELLFLAVEARHGRRACEHGRQGTSARRPLPDREEELGLMATEYPAREATSQAKVNPSDKSVALSGSKPTPGNVAESSR